MTLAEAEFVTARLDEDAAPVPHEGWHETFCMSPEVLPGSDTCFYCGAKQDLGNVQYVPRSARVLADVAAKREILADCMASINNAGAGPGEYGLALSTIRSLAAPYAEHGDYDPQWRPE